MRRILWGGHNVVILNGSAGIYFECKKWVKQGDPFSPYLFLLAVEGLHKILSLCIVNGYFEGLGPVLSNQQKILHLQHADDSLLFVKAQSDMVERLK
jgi:Reverse transcriptase (RNA-dependent DNA polymerase)